MKIMNPFSITMTSLLLFMAVGCNQTPSGTKAGGEVPSAQEERTKAESPAGTPSIPDASDPASEELLRQAALEGNQSQVNSLLEAGTRVDAPDADGHTALMFAAFNGHSEIVLSLLEQGAVLDRRDLMGRTALLYAATGPFPETVTILLDKGASPNVIDSDEHFTPLMHAAAEGNLSVVKVLIGYGADLNMQDVDGDDAESFARQAGHQELADYLHALR